MDGRMVSEEMDCVWLEMEIMSSGVSIIQIMVAREPVCIGHQSRHKIDGRRVPYLLAQKHTAAIWEASLCPSLQYREGCS